MSHPTVSVLMTAYNREKYIAQAIESVLASTFEDFELIIVDDASQDRTAEIARQYLSDLRVQVHVNEKNLGDYPNRNTAASFATGKYLKYLDSDDIIYPFGLEIMVNAMEQFPVAGLGICRPASTTGPYPIKVEPVQAYKEHFLTERGLLDYGPSLTIIRTDVFWEFDGFSGMRYAGDTEMWLRIAARYPIIKLIRDLVWWRAHSGQEYQLGHLSNTYDLLNFCVAKEALTNRLCPLSNTERKKALELVSFLHARTIWRLALRQRQPWAALNLYRRTELSATELMHGLGRWPNGHLESYQYHR
jgi:glycosyltransferase involved in cell wall biosynthesis